MTRLLLIGCSASKRLDPRPLPAGERYTGVLYRVIAKARREGRWPGDLQLAIISAKYGFLLEASPGVEYYDQKMNKRRALELQEEVGSALDAFLQRENFQEVFVALGADYRLSVARSTLLGELLRDERGHLCLVPSIGIMQQQMRYWIDSLVRDK